jgi:hypothetical protein
MLEVLTELRKKGVLDEVNPRLSQVKAWPDGPASSGHPLPNSPA